MNAVTPTHAHALIIEVSTRIVSHLLLWVAEHGVCLTDIFEYLFFLLLFLWCIIGMSVCSERWMRLYNDNSNSDRAAGH